MRARVTVSAVMALCAIQACLLTARRAAAQADGDPALAAAERAFKQALADEQAGQCDKAVIELEQARSLAHKETPQLLFHLGACHAKLGHVLLAREELRAAVDRAQSQGLENVAGAARAQLDQALARVATLTLGRPARGTVKAVSVDGVDSTGKIGTRIEMDPGEHQVEVTYAQGPALRVRLVLKDGDHPDFAWPEPPPSEGASAATGSGAATVPGAAATPGATIEPAPPGTPAEAPAATGSSGLRTLGWVVAGGGAALLAGGGVFWVLRGNAIGTLDGQCGADRQHCDPSLQGTINNGKLYDALGVSMFVAGGAAVLAGAGLVLFGGHGGSAATGVHVAPLPVARGAGLGLEGAIW